MHILTGNEKLCKIYFKKLFSQNVLASIDLFIDIIISPISSIQIACDVMCVQYVQKEPPEMLFKKPFSQKVFFLKRFSKAKDFILTCIFLKIITPFIKIYM